MINTDWKLPVNDAGDIEEIELFLIGNQLRDVATNLILDVGYNIENDEMKRLKFLEAVTLLQSVAYKFLQIK
jgi:hypothetical protein